MQLRYLKYDLYRYFYPNDNVNEISNWQKIKIIIFTQGIWALIVYRLRRWVLTECKNRLIRKMLNIIGTLFQLFVEVATGIWILPQAEIGPGLYIGHFGEIIVGDTKFGKLCNISNGNSFGFAGRGEKWGLPEIGDYVFVAPGAKVFGKIRVGNHVAVGANAVVTKDVPDNAVVVGVPAKIINYDSSRDFVVFNKDKYKEIL
jgi:serine O-acetyltransferase